MLNKLGIIPLAIFVITYPISQEIELLMRSWGIAPPRLERLLPWLGDNVLASFLVYFVLYDFAAYWLHRAQHAIPWWWALHSLHHSQRRMTVWSDDRNHVARRPPDDPGAGRCSRSWSACSPASTSRS